MSAAEEPVAHLRVGRGGRDPNTCGIRSDLRSKLGETEFENKLVIPTEGPISSFVSYFYN